MVQHNVMCVGQFYFVHFSCEGWTLCESNTTYNVNELMHRNPKRHRDVILLSQHRTKTFVIPCKQVPEQRQLLALRRHVRYSGRGRRTTRRGSGVCVLWYLCGYVHWCGLAGVREHVTTCCT